MIRLLGVPLNQPAAATFHWPAQRALASEHLRPQVSDVRNSLGHVSQSKTSGPTSPCSSSSQVHGADTEQASLAPYKRRRTLHCSHCASRVDIDAGTAIDFAEFLRQILRVALDENSANGVCEPRHCAKVGLSVEEQQCESPWSLRS